jgi:hypothetical protein
MMSSIAAFLRALELHPELFHRIAVRNERLRKCTVLFRP